MTEKAKERWRKWRRERGIPEDPLEAKRYYKRRYDEQNHEHVLEYNRQYMEERRKDPTFRQAYKESFSFRVLRRKNYTTYGKALALMKLGGCCIFCFEAEPFKVEQHHPFKNDGKTIVSLCHSCHMQLHWDTDKQQLKEKYRELGKVSAKTRKRDERGRFK